MKADIRVFLFFPMQGSMCVFAADDVEDPILPPVGSHYRDEQSDREGSVRRHLYKYVPIPADKGGGYKAVIEVHCQ